MSFVLRPRAIADIGAIATYIADRNPGAARKWAGSIIDAFELLGDYPTLGHLRDDVRPGVRVYPKGNYLILFRRSGDDAVILRVIHAARDWPRHSR
jgi:toxin ParE1/3/4